MHAAVILQKAICNGSRGSHQNSVDGGYVGTSTPITVGKYCKRELGENQCEKPSSRCCWVSIAVVPVSKMPILFGESSIESMNYTLCSSSNTWVHRPLPNRNVSQALVAASDCRIGRNLCTFSWRNGSYFDRCRSMRCGRDAQISERIRCPWTGHRWGNNAQHRVAPCAIRAIWMLQWLCWARTNRPAPFVGQAI